MICTNDVLRSTRPSDPFLGLRSSRIVDVVSNVDLYLKYKCESFLGLCVFDDRWANRHHVSLMVARTPTQAGEDLRAV